MALGKTSVEIIAGKGYTFAMIIRQNRLDVDSTRFFTDEESPIQFGVIKHNKDYIEPFHYHRTHIRTVSKTYETLHVTQGSVAIDFFEDGNVVRSVELGIGDVILLMDGAHRLRVLSDFEGVKVKQGPYLGLEEDKAFLD